MLVNAKEMLNKAKDGKYAVAGININNLEWAKATLEVAEEMKSPIMLCVTEAASIWMGGLHTAYNMMTGLLKDLNITVPVAIHLDHGGSVEICKKAIDVGFTSVMYDGADDPIEKNVEDTLTVVEYARKHNVSVEAEVGMMLGESENGKETDQSDEGISYASYDDCIKITKTGIDFLAASLGTVHGDFKGVLKIGFEEMKKISEGTGIPLVLHGGSGIPEDMIKKAISLGEAKINVNSDLLKAFVLGIKKFTDDGRHEKVLGFELTKIIGDFAYEDMKNVLREKITLFGSANKA